MLRGEVLDVGQDNVVYVKIPQKYGDDSVKAVTRISVAKGDLVYVADTSVSRVPQWVVFDQMNDVGSWGSPYPHTHPMGQVTGLVARLNAVDSTVQKLSDRTIDVRGLGAKGDGVTNDTAAFQSAINAAATFGVPVVVPPGTYRMSGALTLPTGTDLQMAVGAVLDYSKSSATNFLNINGTSSTPVPAPAISLGAKVVSLSGHGMVAGDWCMIRSKDIFDPHSTSTTHGELIQVASVDAGTVTFRTSVCDSYRTSVTITPVNMVRDVSITGGTIRGGGVPGSNKGGLRAQFTQGLWIHKTRFERIDRAHIFIKDSVNAWVSHCVLDWAESTTMGYGTSFGDTARDSGCIFTTFRAIRHSLSTNNTTDAGVGGVVRRILFFGNTVEDTTYATGGSQLGGDAIDTHTAAEDIWVIQNNVNSSAGAGINMECASGTISGNTVEDTVGTGINYHNEAARAGSVTITDNVVRRAGGHGIQARTGGRGSTIPTESMIITGNRVADTTSNGIQAGYILTDRGVVVANNTIQRAGGVPLRLLKLDGVVSHGNVITGGATMGIECDSITNATLGPDSLDAGTTTGWTGYTLTNVTYSRVTPGAVQVTDPAGVGVRVESSCSNLSLGPTSHLNAPTKLVNNGGSTVTQS